ncbi:MAG: sensor histidine kinase [Cellulomonadaceae bacterium]|nr:sensor histidine kinase [Cellulomonadaceae bacterium]
MLSHALVSVTKGLHRGLDVLVVALSGLSAALAAPGVARALPVACASLFLGIYVLGRRSIKVDDAAVRGASRGSWWPEGAWLVALGAAWLCLSVASPGGVWLGLPLMIVQLRLLGPHLGVLVATGTTAAAVGAATLAGYGLPEIVVGPVLAWATGVVVVVAVEALLRDAEDKQRTFDELTEAREHLAAAEREGAVSHERERLAREIHDSLAQGLSAIDLLLRAARTAVEQGDERASSYLMQAQDAARDNLVEARRVVEALAPVPLDNVTLAGALARLAARVQRANDTGVDAPTVHVQVAGEERPLSVRVESALLRATQSALGNVVQHARARHVALTLTFEPDAVVVDVVDDGQGFDATQTAPRSPHGTHGGFGLTAMASRMRELGGSLSIETSPGEGTAVALRVPTDVFDVARR